MPRHEEMTTPKRRSPPRCGHKEAKPQPTAEAPKAKPNTAPSHSAVRALLADLPIKASAAFVAPDQVLLLLPEPDRDDDVSALRRLVPPDVPTVVFVVPAAGTYFAAEFSPLTGLLTSWFPSCDGEPPHFWSQTLGGEHAATRLFLRLHSFFDDAREQRISVAQSFVPARAGKATRTCCANACAVNWCRACVAAWALTKASQLAAPTGEATQAAPHA